MVISGASTYKSANLSPRSLGSLSNPDNAFPHPKISDQESTKVCCTSPRPSFHSGEDHLLCTSFHCSAPSLGLSGFQSSSGDSVSGKGFFALRTLSPCARMLKALE